MSNNVPAQLVNILSETERARLRDINKTVDSETRQQQLKSFFHDPLIFDKVKSLYDPTWIAYDIFINKDRYEFQ